MIILMVKKNMIVDHNLQNVKYDIKELPLCPFPAVKLKHEFNDLLSWEEIVENTNKYIINK